jgi:hypothetical protein
MGDIPSTVPPSGISWLSPRLTRWLVPILLLFGIECWLVLGAGDYGPPRKSRFLLACLIAGLIPPVSRAFNRLYIAIASPSPRTRRLIALAIWIASTLFLLWSQPFQKISLHPKWEDEFSYLIQMHMLAHGHFWMPPIPFPRYFETFYMFVTPVYASMYFPGAAMTIVPAIWLRLPYYVSPLLCGAAAAGMMFLIMREMFGAPRALVAVLLLLSLQFFRWMCFMLMSETAFLLAAMILIWAWMRWRRRKNFGWAMLIGAAAGWAAITRPLDAACFCTPIGIAIAFELRKSPTLLVRAAAAIALAAAPFAAIQIVQNIGVTGKWTQTPMQYYVNESYPAPLLGFAKPAMNALPPNLSQTKRAYAKNDLDLYHEHTPVNVLKTLYSVRFHQLRLDTLATPALLIAFPLALAATWDIRRSIFVASGALILIAYLAYIIHLDQYLVAVMPAVICLVLMGWDGLVRAWPRHRRRINAFVAPALIGAAPAGLPELGAATPALPNVCESAKQINDGLSSLTSPFLVLFPYSGDSKSIDFFPVYNDTVAWPDDARTLRANDLGTSQNWKPYDYYAHVQPNRRVFVYEPPQRGYPHNLRFLGTARDLASNHARQ